MELVVAIICIGSAFIAGLLLGERWASHDWRRDAIKAGWAQYDPLSGKWQWLKRKQD
jgi:hypothetical protein